MCLIWVWGSLIDKAVQRADPADRVLSVKGKKVLHIDRNDHYGGFVYLFQLKLPKSDELQRGSLRQYRSCW